MLSKVEMTEAMHNLVQSDLFEVLTTRWVIMRFWKKGRSAPVEDPQEGVRSICVALNGPKWPKTEVLS